MTADPCSILALSLSPGLGLAAVRRALAASDAAKMPLSALLSLPWRDASKLLPPGLHVTADDFRRCTAAVQDRARLLLKRTAEAGVQTLSIVQEDYPTLLRDALGNAAPPLLFVAGDLALLHTPAAAVVGARDPSPQGKRLAAACAEILSREKATIVSGGARGVDSAAHESALRSGGKTVVVLPQGLLTYRGPAAIFEAVQDGHATLLSQFAPDMHWETHAAVTRNATISALSKLLCVLEPKKTGGSVCTARCALAQGKRVLVYPAKGFESVTQSLARGGALELIKGASPVELDALPDLWRAADMSRPEQTTFPRAQGFRASSESVFEKGP